MIIGNIFSKKSIKKCIFTSNYKIMAKKVEVKPKNKEVKPKTAVSKIIEKITPKKQEEKVDEVVELVKDAPMVQILKYLAKSNSDILIKINDVLIDVGLPLQQTKLLLEKMKHDGLINIQNNYQNLGNVSLSGEQNLNNVVVKAMITTKGLQSL